MNSTTTKSWDTFLSMKEIEEKANTIRLNFYEDNSLIDPVKLAGLMGISVYSVIFENIYNAGQVTNRSGAPRIFVDTDIEKKHFNFVVAHEIGHWILHLQDTVGTIIDKSHDMKKSKMTIHDNLYLDERLRREVAANWFAGALLMPKTMLVKKTEPMTEIAVVKLAQDFEVTEKTMLYRLKCLDLIQSLLPGRKLETV